MTFLVTTSDLLFFFFLTESFILLYTRTVHAYLHFTVTSNVAHPNRIESSDQNEIYLFYSSLVCANTYYVMLCNHALCVKLLAYYASEKWRAVIVLNIAKEFFHILCTYMEELHMGFFGALKGFIYLFILTKLILNHFIVWKLHKLHKVAIVVTLSLMTNKFAPQ